MYTNDTVLIASNLENPKRLIDEVTEISEEYGLSKTKVIIIPATGVNLLELEKY